MLLQYNLHMLLIINFLFFINFIFERSLFFLTFAIFVALSMKFSVHNNVYLLKMASY